VRGKYEYGFFEVFYGFGAPEIKLEFSNVNSNIYLDNTSPSTNELGLNFYDHPYVAGNALYPYHYYNAGTVTFDKLKTAGYGPVAMRVGGYGNGMIGGDFEFSYESRKILAQDPTSTVDGDAVAVSLPDAYATVKTFGMSLDLLLRLPSEKVDPYFGLGLGLSMNTIDLPNVWGINHVAPTSEFAPGLMFRIPIGIRVRTSNHVSFVAEMRYELNSMTFTRGFVGETDTIKISGVKFLAGMGLTF